MAELPNFPNFASPTRDAIFAAYEAQADTGFRAHLGASLIGKDCERALWFDFRWTTRAKQQAAAAIGANEYWLCAANSLGVSAGKMLSPQSIAIGTASCGLVGKDGEVLGKIAPYAFGFVIIIICHLNLLLKNPT